MSAKECDKTKIFRLFVLFLWFEFRTTSNIPLIITTARTRVYSIFSHFEFARKDQWCKTIGCGSQTDIVCQFLPSTTLDNNLRFCSTKNIMLFYYFPFSFFFVTNTILPSAIKRKLKQLTPILIMPDSPKKRE